jgi:hypothetical protein
MKPDLDKLRADVDRLPPGPDKDRMLGDIELLQQHRHKHESVVGWSAIDRVGGILLFCPVAYLLLSGLYHKRFTNFFLKQRPPAYWETEPFMFLLIGAFLTVAALCFLGMAFGIWRIGGRR